jgi:hypothetical protein
LTNHGLSKKNKKERTSKRIRRKNKCNVGGDRRHVKNKHNGKKSNNK